MSPGRPTRQAGAIPFRLDAGRLEFCLITSSSNTSFWTLPKGSIEPGDSPETTALKESLEEAGIVGEVVGESLGTFEYQKNGGDYTVEMFLLRVTEVHEHWEEAHVRRRQWVGSDEAALRLRAHPALAIFKDGHARLTAA